MTVADQTIGERTSHHFRIAGSNNDDENIIATAFANDGFVILKKALETDLLLEWKQFGRQYFEECFQTLYKNGHTRAPTHIGISSKHDDNGDDKNSNKNKNSNSQYVLGHGAKHGFREIVMRSPGRYELSLLDMIKMNDDDENDTSLPEMTSLIKPLETLLPKLLSSKRINNANENYDNQNVNNKEESQRKLSDLKLCHLSLLISAPGSTDQGWHADGGHVNIQRHLPCHCYNVFIPLQDIPLHMGPTEFRPGGHFLTRNLGPMMLAAKCRKTLRPPVWPALTLGDVAIFDYRILHRGRANQTCDTTRDVLVLTYCEPWFEDVLNFPKRSMMEPAEGEVKREEVMDQES